MDEHTGISNRETPAEEARGRETHPPIDTNSPEPRDAAGRVGEDPLTDLNDRHTSHKAGSRSIAQKEAGARYPDRGMPATHKVPGAFGKEPKEEAGSVTHKDAAKAFLKMAGAGQVQDAYDRYVAPSFIHHNPYFKGDRQSLLTAMQEASKTSPNKSIDIWHVYEDGETVITHSLVTRKDPEASGIAVVHIFRFENDRIVELWDLGQPISKDSPNQNGMF